MDINNQIVITSVNKAIDRARVSGNLFLRPLYLFSVYNYYINNDEILRSIYGDNYLEILRTLKQLLSNLKYKYPNEVCNYKTSFVIPFKKNSPPEVDNIMVYSSDIIYQFTIDDFTYNYRDDQNDSWNELKIQPLLGNSKKIGKLLYNGLEVTEIITIHHSEINNLIFERDPNYYRLDTSQRESLIYSNIIFQISDDNPNSLFSNSAIVKLVLDNLENEPPTIEDIAINADNRVETILTIDMFESTYNDPEGDPLDAIKILRVSDSNEGVFLYNSNPVTIGQVITRNEIINGALTHEGADSDSIESDQLDFAVRDNGSFIWVE